MRFKGYDRHLFETPLVEVPGTYKPGTKDIPIKWGYKEVDKREIEKIVPNCGCTADIFKGPDGIYANYNDSTKKEAVEKSPGGVKVITKSVTVYFDDGKPLQIKNARGVMEKNPEKSSYVLTFHVRLSV